MWVAMARARRLLLTLLSLSLSCWPSVTVSSAVQAPIQIVPKPCHTCKPSSIFKDHATAYFATHSPRDYRPDKCSVVLRVGVLDHVEASKRGWKGWGKAMYKWLAQYARALHHDGVNATIGIHGGDYTRGDPWCCLSNSVTPSASRAVFYQPEAFDDAHSEAIEDTPWAARSDVPIFRGNLRLQHLNGCSGCRSLGEIVANEIAGLRIDQTAARLIAFAYSSAHPDLLDARPSGAGWGDRHLSQPVWRANATNGLHAFLPFKANQVSPATYYAHSKAALVLAGIGAAFRLDYHLRVGAAVIFEAFPYELWYVRYMVPNVHYIPLAMGASNLTAVLNWTRANPAQVREIGWRGRQFYTEHLSPQARDSNMLYFLREVAKFVEQDPEHARVLRERNLTK